MASAKSGLAALKKPFTWKFGYPKFQRKMKLHFENDSELVKPEEGYPSIPWDINEPEAACEGAKSLPLPTDKVSWDFCVKNEHEHQEKERASSNTGSEVKPAAVDTDDCESQQSSASSEIYCTINEPLDSSEVPEYDNSFDNGESGPVYENTSQPLYMNSSASVDTEEHIYEHVGIVFPQDIYQVPNRVVPIYSNDTLTRNLLPPVGFQDLDELSYILHTDVIYSTVVKPKRKKLRPPLSAMLNKELEPSVIKITVNSTSEMGLSGEGDVATNNAVNQLKTETIETVYENVNGDGKKCVESSDLHIYANIDVQPADQVIYENVPAEDLASVIEILEDGTWATKDLPPTEVDQAKDDQQSSPVMLETCLSTESVKIKHAALAYGSQYYVNCPVASVKPMPPSEPKDTPDGAEDDRNIGAQIMKQYEQDRQKVRDSLNLPDVSLLDVEASMEDIAKERRRIIENQAVRAKRIDSWIRNGEHAGEYSEEPLSGEWEGEGGCPKTTPEGEEDGHMPAEGEVVCDSILQNKHKTKTYWEQLMMAAAASDQPKAQYHAPPQPQPQPQRREQPPVNNPDDNKPTSDASEQDFFDARSQISLNSPVDALDSLDETNSGPKIVETVAKKLLEADNNNVKVVNKTSEGMIAREIRLQKEKEDSILRERESVFQKPTPLIVVPEAVMFDASVNVIVGTPTPTPAETKIAIELREMREREEELRKLRQSLTNGKEEEDALGSTVITVDDNFNSIPNTDEGNFSEYGSEEKELSLDGNNSRMMSPEVPNQGSFSHQRTQSMDSMSSGHSSGSGSGAHPPETFHRRRITVKPLEEPEEEEAPAYMRPRDNSLAEEPIFIKGLRKVNPNSRNQKETPIEREIRLSREREEELRREKRLPPQGIQPSPLAKQEVRRTHRNAITNDPRSVQHRLATNRIQQEINEATEREKELRSAGTIQTVSEDTVDSKVTRFIDLAEYAIEEQDRKLQRAVSTSHIASTETPVTIPIAPKPPSTLALNGTARPALNRSISSSPLTPNTHSPTMSSPVRRFGPALGQKGLMERFLASRGKLTNLNTFGNSPSPNFTTNPQNFGYSGSPNISPIPRPDNSPMSLPSMPTPKAAVIDVTPIDERQLTLEGVEKDRERTSTPIRKGYKSAEDKIQMELQEMRKREEELRLQRARSFARSQPNLLSIMDDADEEPALNGDFDAPMTIGGLRAALSNPNLLDSEDSDHLEKPSCRIVPKRNAMIAQWENRIQQYTGEH